MRVAILAGSPSDQKFIDGSGVQALLEAVGITVYVGFVSAHRNGRELSQWLDDHADDFDGFIGTAGLAAALPGAIAGHLNTGNSIPKPVFGVPLDNFGADSIMQTAPGVPVPCFANGERGLKQAALALATALSVNNRQLSQSLQQYLRENNKQPQLPPVED